MSGFHERLIEGWLTSSDERGYQYAFAGLLGRRGHRVVYFSGHSTGEHGKDLVTIDPAGRLCAYQLKVGKVGTSQWREWGAEVREAAELPYRSGGKSRLPDRAFLVATGRIADPVLEKISLVNDANAGRYCPIETIELDEIVADFSRWLTDLLPAVEDSSYTVARLHISDPRGSPDIQLLIDSVLWPVLERQTGRSNLSRRTSDLLVIAAFTTGRYRAIGNHMAVLDGWTSAASQLLRLSLAMGKVSKEVSQALQIAKAAIAESAQALVSEAARRSDLFEGTGTSEQVVYHYRRTLVIGYVGACLNFLALEGNAAGVSDRSWFVEFVKREIPYQPWGEGAWNYILNAALALRGSPTGVTLAEALVLNWIQYVCPVGGKPVRDVYWTIQDELAAIGRSLEPDTGVRTAGSYSASAAVDVLVRALSRRSVAAAWKQFSKFDHMEVVPDQAADLFSWSVKRGEHRIARKEVRGSWGDLRREAAKFADALEFPREFESILPLVLCVLPHRTQRELAGLLDNLMLRA